MALPSWGVRRAVPDSRAAARSSACVFGGSLRYSSKLAPAQISSYQRLLKLAPAQAPQRAPHTPQEDGGGFQSMSISGLAAYRAWFGSSRQVATTASKTIVAGIKKMLKFLGPWTSNQLSGRTGYGALRRRVTSSNPSPGAQTRLERPTLRPACTSARR